MKKKITALLCAVFLIGTFGFGQIRDRWLIKPFTEILELNKQLLIKELSSAPSHTSGYGTLFVLSSNGELYYKDDEGNVVAISAAAADAFTVKVDAAATAGYFGVAIGDGIFRVTENQFTIADGGNYVTLSLADHDTARDALGLAIGTDVLAEQAIGIADDNLLEVDDVGPPAAGQYARFTANGLEGRTEVEFKGDFSLAIGTDVEAWDADLDTYAGITPSADVQSVLGCATEAAIRTFLDLEAGTDFNAYDAALNDISGLTYVSGSFIALTANDDYTVRTYAQTLSDIGAAASSHAMSTHSDEDTYDISTSGKATVTEGYIHGAETTATPSAGFTVDWTVTQVQRVTITGAALDITFTNPPGPCKLVLVVVQGDGDDTIDWTNEADILFPGNVDPTLSTGAGDIDMVTFYFDGTSYLGVANFDFS